MVSFPSISVIVFLYVFDSKPNTKVALIIKNLYPPFAITRVAEKEIYAISAFAVVPVHAAVVRVVE
jgi:hypothetical protein